MDFVTAETGRIDQAAQDLVRIRTGVDEATSAAAASTTALLPAAHDEISTAIAAVFSDFGQKHQAANAEAAQFHNSFANLMKTSATAYAEAEVANAAALPPGAGLGALASQTGGFISGFVGDELESTGIVFLGIGRGIQGGGVELSSLGALNTNLANGNIAQETAILNSGFNAPDLGLLLGNILGIAPTGGFLQILGAASQSVGGGLTQAGMDLFDAGVPLVQAAFAAS